MRLTALAAPVAVLGLLAGCSDDSVGEGSTTTSSAPEAAACSPDYGHLLLSLGVGDSLQHTDHRVISFANLRDTPCTVNGSPQIDFATSNGEVVYGVEATTDQRGTVVPPHGVAFVSLTISTACDLMEPADVAETKADVLQVYIGGKRVAAFVEPWVLCNLTDPDFLSVSVGGFSLDPNV